MLKQTENSFATIEYHSFHRREKNLPILWIRWISPLSRPKSTEYRYASYLQGRHIRKNQIKVAQYSVHHPNFLQNNYRILSYLAQPTLKASFMSFFMDITTAKAEATTRTGLSHTNTHMWKEVVELTTELDYLINHSLMYLSGHRDSRVHGKNEDKLHIGTDYGFMISILPWL